MQVGSFFRIEEFDCRNGVVVPRSAEAALRRWCVMWGDPLRRRFGPVSVTSGYRTAAYNRAVGGAADSYHVYDRRHTAAKPNKNVWDLAVDVVPKTGDVDDWQAWASAVLRRGTHDWPASRGAAVGYPRQGFIHLDSGPRRTWAG